jgi:hypothetical protein
MLAMGLRMDRFLGPEQPCLLQNVRAFDQRLGIAHRQAHIFFQADDHERNHVHKDREAWI